LLLPPPPLLTSCVLLEWRAEWPPCLQRCLLLPLLPRQRARLLLLLLSRLLLTSCVQLAWRGACWLSGLLLPLLLLLPLKLHWSACGRQLPASLCPLLLLLLPLDPALSSLLLLLLLFLLLGQDHHHSQQQQQ
jgi:hypothetical protein